MPTNIDPSFQLVQSSDLEKINFWKAKGRLTTLSWGLLSLSHYITEYGESEGTGEKDGKTMTGPVHSLPEGTEILFWSPQDEKGRNKLEEILANLHERRLAIMSDDAIMKKYAGAGRSRDVEYLQRQKDRIKTPLIMTDGRTNAFFDSLRFKVSEIGMSELRQMPFLQRLSIERKERELNDD